MAETTFVGESGSEIIHFCDADRIKRTGIAVVVDTSKATDLVRRMRSIIASGTKLGLPEDYIKEQSQLFEEIIHVIPKAVEVFAQFGDAISNKSDRLSA